MFQVKVLVAFWDMHYITVIFWFVMLIKTNTINHQLPNLYIIVDVIINYAFVRKKRINEMSQVIYTDQCPQDIKKKHRHVILLCPFLSYAKIAPYKLYHVFLFVATQKGEFLLSCKVLWICVWKWLLRLATKIISK